MLPIVIGLTKKSFCMQVRVRIEMIFRSLYKVAYMFVGSVSSMQLLKYGSKVSMYTIALVLISVWTSLVMNIEILALNLKVQLLISKPYLSSSLCKILLSKYMVISITYGFLKLGILTILLP
jgi:hypothetical protein